MVKAQKEVFVLSDSSLISLIVSNTPHSSIVEELDENRILLVRNDRSGIIKAKNVIDTFVKK